MQLQVLYHRHHRLLSSCIVSSVVLYTSNSGAAWATYGGAFEEAASGRTTVVPMEGQGWRARLPMEGQVQEGVRVVDVQQVCKAFTGAVCGLRGEVSAAEQWEESSGRQVACLLACRSRTAAFCVVDANQRRCLLPAPPPPLLLCSCLTRGGPAAP